MHFGTPLSRFPLAIQRCAVSPLLLFPLLFATSIRAATIDVPAGVPTIAAALASASPGDTVLVACGTYLEHDLTMASGVVLRGASGDPACVTIDAARLSRVLLCYDTAEGTSIEAITIANGKTRGITHGRDGRHSPESDDSSAIGDDDAFLEAVLGGAIRSESVLQIGAGGGGAGVASLLGHIAFRDCVFRDNETSAAGGAIRVTSASATIERCTFEDNLAKEIGGAVALEYSTDSSIQDCRFASNRARAGGAVSLLRSSEVLLANCVFFANRAVAWPPLVSGSGGAILSTSSSFVLEASTLASNVAAVRGSGIYLGGLATSLEVHRSIIAFGSTGAAIAATGGAVATLECCDVFANVGGDYVGPIAGQLGQSGNISENPRFCDLAGGGLGLSTSSSCLPAYNSCGVQIGAFGEGCPSGAGVVLTTSPAGLSITVDGVTATTPVFRDWPSGSSHTLATTSPQSIATGTRAQFSSWSDGGAISHTVVHDSLTTEYVASFQYEHFVTISSGTGGTASPASAWHPQGASVTITGTPNLNFAFNIWSGTGSGSYSGPINPASIQVLGPISEAASFFYTGPYNLTMQSNPTGGGTTSPPSGPFTQGTVVAISATPGTHYNFDRWIGSGSGSYNGTNNPASVTMNGNITQTARFVPNTYPLTMIAGPHGSVLPASGNFPALGNVTIQATPQAGYVFSGWVGTGPGSYSGSSNPAVVNMQGPITQTASFALGQFNLTMIALPGGTVTPPSGQYAGLSQVTLTAFPDSGGVFGGWVGTGPGGYSGLANPVTITMLGNITQRASFAISSGVTFTTDPPERRLFIDGVETATPVTYGWPAGSVHSVEADSVLAIDAGSRLRYASWSDGLERFHYFTTPSTDNVIVTASFALQYLLTVAPSPYGSTVPGTSWHDATAGVSVTAVANPNFAFESWTGAGNGSYTGAANPAVVTMNAPLTQTAAYHSIGFDFSISSSLVDPFENVSEPTDGVRPLYLWATCAEEGLAAFQGRVSGSLAPLSFVPAMDAFNIGTATDLLLAVGGCPTGESIAKVLGAWIVIDSGGDLCFELSTPSAPFVAVDCDSISPSVVTNPRVLGYSSSGSAPCVLNVNPCSSSGPPPAADLSMLRSGDRAPAALAAPLTDSFVGVSPNPFEGTTEIRFSTATARPAEVAIYDVTGRLVRRIVDGTLPAGEHRLAWDGRNAGGERAPSGVYFLRLQSGPLERTEKIVSIGGR